MYLSDVQDEHVWTRYMAVDKMRHYKQVLYSTHDLKRFSINGETFSRQAVEDENIFDIVDALVLYQGGKDSTIQELVLESFVLSPVGWKSLSGALRKLFRLKKLFLREILVVPPSGFDDSRDHDDGIRLVEGLSGLVEACPNLEELHLVECNLHPRACGFLSGDLFEGPSPRRPPSLRVLSLEGNPIGNEGVCLLAEAIRDNGSLVALDLDRVGCSGSGMAALADALGDNDCLESLSLVGNEIGGERGPLRDEDERDICPGEGRDAGDGADADKAGCPFCDLLARNTRLKRVRLFQTEASQISPPPPPVRESFAHVDFLLRLNRRGRRYLGDADVIPKVFPLMLESASDDADVIYSFLKSQSGFTKYRSLQ
ncbi:unnamed protein product [Pseudo-nitzschia multistriata]|uniref:Uncharacterized protein n=1 Tax=Pseudo-nitzschia multistriata TaxID=183589 RepID=A0A448ZG78_9STRA|nr:unnamed protein product [Pseudo-nitzschia multistriata]